MKKVLFSFRKIAVITMGVALLSGFMVSCNKKDAVSTPIPAAGVMVFNLAADQPAVGFALSGNVLSNVPLSYTSFNGFYQPVYTGTREIQAFGFNDSLFAKSSFTFDDQGQYSVFLTGYNGKYQNVTVKDDIDSNATADKAYVRFINAIPDSVNVPKVTITAGGSTVSDGAAAFNTVVPFTAVAGGDVKIAVTGTGVSAERTLQLVNGKVYTALLIGVPGATDELKKVQIRYIENGTLPAATDK
ncbi:MAG: DUF4397 domain-containing protein [Chitinophagaceae bacterium]|nr:MAG: DUF4397 domain-containing protein [Chitinophagaceae bacterium]